MEELGRQNIRTVLIEECKDGRKRKPSWFFIYFKKADRWSKYSFKQCFGRRRDFKDIDKFVGDELPKRIMGSVCVLLCGEINGVEYSDGQIEDDYRLSENIPTGVRIILNPAHDLMTRHEMEKKRRFLSKPGRVIISVWNKGKLFKDAKTGKRKQRKESDPWLAFRGGDAIEVKRVAAKDLGVEMGIVDAA